MQYLLKIMMIGTTLFTYHLTMRSQGTSSFVNNGSKHNVESCQNSIKAYEACIQNSTWVVPPETLLAYTYIEKKYIPVSDQTVWTINNFNQGYFFGESYTSINHGSFSQRHLIGSVTPFGDVYITFYPVKSAIRDTDLVQGIGKIILDENGQCAFVMQMNSGQNNFSGLTHWSYMISVKKHDPYYKRLPGENISVPEFLKKFSK